MNQGIRTIIYPVGDLARAKDVFRELLGTEPYVDQPYYVGFRLGDQEVGLDPNGHKQGMTPYWQVDDIRTSVQSLVDAGAKVVQEVSDVGGGKLTAAVTDPDGNVIGLTQEP
ncbi:MAG: VOC family protein [Acidimicrobiia bacterium]